ncbi:MAG: hypothetical protein OXI81_18990 [Paracoccaceae bacterium]|nr:hypothetical protein [Paracoccaceae bacterium]
MLREILWSAVRLPVGVDIVWVLQIRRIAITKVNTEMTTEGISLAGMTPDDDPMACDNLLTRHDMSIHGLSAAAMFSLCNQDIVDLRDSID